MTAKERILAIELLIQQNQKPEYLKKIGVQVHLVDNCLDKKKDNHS